MNIAIDFRHNSIPDLIKSFKSGKLTSLQLVNYCIKKIEETHEDLNAVIIRNFEPARELAKQADENIKNGIIRKLEGIPYIGKALFCSKGLETNACSRILEGFIAPYESTVTEKLHNEGAILLGHSNMDEFAMGGSTTRSMYGPTYNFYKRSDGKKVIAGGSSGGSASAVAAGLAPFALGSDTGGSVRQPAALSGCVGIKPTFGRCSRYGMIAFASSLDQAGVLANSVEEAAYVLQIISGYDERDSTCLQLDVPNYAEYIGKPIKGKRIGIPVEVNAFELNPDIRRLWEKTKEDFRRHGCEIVDINLPNIPYSIATYYMLAPIEASSNLARYDGIRYGASIPKGTAESLENLYVKNRSEKFGEEVKRRLLLGTFLLSGENHNTYYGHAKKLRNLIYLDFVKAFENVDAIVIPTSPVLARAIDEQSTVLEDYMADLLTVSISLANMPAISVPVGFSDSKLPIGMQIIANTYCEQTVFQLAKVLCDLHAMNC